MLSIQNSKFISNFYSKLFIIFFSISVLQETSGQGVAQLFSGLSGMVDAAKSIKSMTSFLTNWASPPEPTELTGKRDGKEERYRHNYYINPVIKQNITTRKRHVPRLWDMASTTSSYRVEFMLYNRDNLTIGESVQVFNASQSQYFNASKETKMIIHDFNQTYAEPVFMSLKDDVNIIIVDWMQARKYSYTVAAKVTEYVGVTCARGIRELNADISRVHVIGFGLGAHAAGVMGSELNGKLQRITGLDPSLPLFRFQTVGQKLDESDALFVDVIHSDSGDNFWHSSHLGMGNVMGHVDVFVNSGIFQPGCPKVRLPSYEDMYCSHIRALQLYLESVQDKERVIACSCDEWTKFQSMECDCTTKMMYVGDSCPKKATGKFYMVTRGEPPFGMGRNGAFPIPQFQRL